jgi:hypothetical protein
VLRPGSKAAERKWPCKTFRGLIEFRRRNINSANIAVFMLMRNSCTISYFC